MVAAIHAKAEVFDPRAEYAFAYLQASGGADWAAGVAVLQVAVPEPLKAPGRLVLAPCPLPVPTCPTHPFLCAGLFCDLRHAGARRGRGGRAHHAAQGAALVSCWSWGVSMLTTALVPLWPPNLCRSATWRARSQPSGTSCKQARCHQRCGSAHCGARALMFACGVWLVCVSICVCLQAAGRHRPPLPATHTPRCVLPQVSAPVWIILISASGLVVGLATYGYKVTQVRTRVQVGGGMHGLPP